jgi:hypothetical protein
MNAFECVAETNRILTELKKRYVRYMCID